MNSEADKTKHFFISVLNNDVSNVEKLLSSAAVDINIINPEDKNRTALHIAAQKGHYNIVKTLVDKYNAQVNVVDIEGKIPLQLATDRYHMKIVKFLIKRNSVLPDYAARYLNSEKVEELFEAAHINHIGKVIELINEGVDVNSEDVSDFRRTILEVAASKGYNDLVQVIVNNHEADIQHDDDIGESAYHKAMNYKHDNIAKFLLNKGYENPYAVNKSYNHSEENKLK